MAIFDLTDIADFGFRMSTKAGFTAPIGGTGTLSLLALAVLADGGGAGTFTVEGNSLADKIWASYTVESAGLRLRDVVYVNGEAENVVTIYDLGLLVPAEEITRAAVIARLNAGDDSFYGNEHPDLIRGGAGRDTIESYDGDDRLFGDAGGDDVEGGNGNDLLDGGSGNDTLTGGAGRDLLTGGAGIDRFVFENRSESLRGVAQRDTIRDFQHLKDEIDLSGIDADEGSAGNQTFAWIGDAVFSGKAGELRFADNLLQADVDGDKRVDFEVKVIGSLSASDFLL